MIVTDEEKARLNSLRGDTILIGYFKRLCDELADLRKVGAIKETEMLGRLEAVRVIEKYFIEPLELPNKKTSLQNKDYK